LAHLTPFAAQPIRRVVPTGGPNGAVSVVANKAPLSLVDGPRCQSCLQRRKPRSELAHADSVLRTRRPDLPVPHCGFCWDLGLYGEKDRGGPATPQKHRRALPLFTTSSRRTQIAVEVAALCRSKDSLRHHRCSAPMSLIRAPLVSSACAQLRCRSAVATITVGQGDFIRRRVVSHRRLAPALLNSW
jgi:hypothetical protein